MAKGSNQKLKLLYILKFLNEETDEKHRLSTADFIDKLAAVDIPATRKTIYSDIEDLRQFGYDIMGIREDNYYGYYMASRDFELPELQLLVDSIQSSKFITLKKTQQLISKIEHLTNTHVAGQLHRRVYVKNRVKTMNESIYYSIDYISEAINGNKAISFKYYEYTAQKKRVYKNNGKLYTASPYALVWDDENYYLVCFDHDAEIIKHFRVDKLADIKVLDTPREGKALFEATDMSAYTKKVFGMFNGDAQKVTIRFANHLAGVVLDRFGADTMLVPSDAEHFTVTTEIAVSPIFYGWLFGFGREAEVIWPESVRTGMRNHILQTAELYT